MTSQTIDDIFQRKETRDSIKDLLNQSRKKSDFQRAQCVWLRIEFNMKADQVSQVTGLKPNTVRKIWSQFKKEGVQALHCKTKGGRRNAYMTVDEEKLFLSPFFKKAESSGVLIASDLHIAYEKRTGQQVPKSTVYRLLKRHGWKKKPRKSTLDRDQNQKHNPEMHDYWIEGCSQSILPKQSGNISQQWLNSTLSSLIPNPTREE